MSQDIMEYVLPADKVEAYFQEIINTVETNAVNKLQECLDGINEISGDTELKTFASTLNNNQKELILNLAGLISLN